MVGTVKHLYNKVHDEKLFYRSRPLAAAEGEKSNMQNMQNKYFGERHQVALGNESCTFSVTFFLKNKQKTHVFSQLCCRKIRHSSHKKKYIVRFFWYRQLGQSQLYRSSCLPDHTFLSRFTEKWANAVSLWRFPQKIVSTFHGILFESARWEQSSGSDVCHPNKKGKIIVNRNWRTHVPYTTATKYALTRIKKKKRRKRLSPILLGATIAH